MANDNQPGEVCETLRVQHPAEGSAERPGEVLGQGVDRKVLRLREHYATIAAEASRLTGIPAERLLDNTRSKLAVSVRVTLIKAIYDSSHPKDHRHLAAFFNKDRTTIAHCAGVLQRKPKWDMKLYQQIDDFIWTLPEGLSGPSDGGRGKMTEKRRKQLTDARERMKIKSAQRGSRFKTEETRIAALSRFEEVKKLYAARNALIRAARAELPKKGEPLIRQMFSIMARDMTTVRELAIRSGVDETSISHWKNCRKSPTLANVVACYQVLGYRLKPVPIDRDDEDLRTSSG